MPTPLDSEVTVTDGWRAVTCIVILEWTQLFYLPLFSPLYHRHSRLLCHLKILALALVFINPQARVLHKHSPSQAQDCNQLVGTADLLILDLHLYLCLRLPSPSTTHSVHQREAPASITERSHY